MTTYMLIASRRYSENTAEYGHGDFPETIDYIKGVYVADTLRKAQNAAKKEHPRVRFGGLSPWHMVEQGSEYAYLYLKPADARLPRECVHEHRASLEALA
jgi:hypothetical protein